MRGGDCLQANTVIASDASRRDDAFTDVDVNLSGPAVQAAPLENGHSAPPQVCALADPKHNSAEHSTTKASALRLPCVRPCRLQAEPAWRISGEPLLPWELLTAACPEACQHLEAVRLPRPRPGQHVLTAHMWPDQANGAATPRSASRRAPAPMPAAAKEALTDSGGRSRPQRASANGKASPAKGGSPAPAGAEGSPAGGGEPKGAAEAWSEAQELALVQASRLFSSPCIPAVVHVLAFVSSACRA